jgi:tRNA-modifying protein YgfZ
MADVTADYLALRHDVGAVAVDRDVIRAEGADAVTYLQGQLSADVAGLAVGESTPAFLLEPQGKVVAWLRATRTGDTVMTLDLDAGFAEPVLERLERFKIRTDCTFERVDWRCVAVRGPRAAAIDADHRRVAAPWPGLDGFDLLGPDVVVPDGVRECGTDAYETVRVEAGVPRMGSEVTEKTMPHELGRWLVVASVSFTKGCYTGQELVYRIDARGGNVPRHLRGVLVATNVLPPVGAQLEVGGKTVGELTSVGESLERRAPVALAFVHRSVDPPADGELTWDGADRVPCRVEPLPLVTSG